jgi:hypothetical protein
MLKVSVRVLQGVYGQTVENSAPLSRLEYPAFFMPTARATMQKIFPISHRKNANFYSQPRPDMVYFKLDSHNSHKARAVAQDRQKSEHPAPQRRY